MDNADVYPVVEIDVSSEDRRDEQLGSKAKFWFTHSDRKEWLFKRGRQNEDWSEKAAAALAGHLGLPHAEVELARCAGQSGTISRSFLLPGDQLVHGNELLFELDTSYPMMGRFHVSKHTVEAVVAAFERFQVSVWSECPERLPDSFDGWDLFLGYLLLDAWIGNTDRHHENWAVVQRGEKRLLSPSYDHASSMGRNETEERAQVRLRETDPRVTVKSYAEKCRSALFDPLSTGRPMLAMDAFFYAARQRPAARGYWLSRLESTQDSFVHKALQQIPDGLISTAHRKFAYEIIMFNRGRLLDARTRDGDAE
ncbi:HipA domain-containing protein [Stigmatella hybrida]|uniref:hypothetical protein n=1 Tax=Stigmatella hybrida TaxID=394097 RepID=UPI001CDA6649|nr:hypothetical protein [Stigmatella hybrida]